MGAGGGGVWAWGVWSVLRTGEGMATPPAATGSPELHHGSDGHIRGGERGGRPWPPASALSMPPLRLPVGMLPRLGANPQQITAPGSRKKRLIPFALLLAAPIPGPSERELSSPRCPQGPASPKTENKDDNPRISSSRDPLSSERWMEKAGGVKSEVRRGPSQSAPTGEGAALPRKAGHNHGEGEQSLPDPSCTERRVGGAFTPREEVTLEEAAAGLHGGSRGEGQPQHGVRALGLRAQPGPQPGVEPGHRQPHTCRGGGGGGTDREVRTASSSQDAARAWLLPMTK